jgi:hypothetical protein
MYLDHLAILHPKIKIRPNPCIKCKGTKLETHNYRTTKAATPWRLVCQNNNCGQKVEWFADLEQALEAWNKLNPVR